MLQQVTLEVIVHETLEQREFGNSLPLDRELFGRDDCKDLLELILNGLAIGLLKHRPGRWLHVKNGDG